MMMIEKNLYIVAGCNGAGKTTASFTFLPEIIHCREFVNADEIARGISPFQPEEVSIEAGRIMLERIENLIQHGENFAFETTLATKSHRGKILKAKNAGFTVTLMFFWLKSVELAKERVKIRVQEGGHFIDDATIERRYKNGLVNLFEIFLPLSDGVMVFDNSDGLCELIAQKTFDQGLRIHDQPKYNEILKYYENYRGTN